MMIKKYLMQNMAMRVDVWKLRRDEGWLDLNPPYQRGDVWGEKRRQNLIKSILLGIPIASIITNNRWAATGEYNPKESDSVIIDGKQRITTILMFLDDELQVKGEWFGLDQYLVRYSQITETSQRQFRSSLLPIVEAQVPTIKEEEKIFNLINFGGVKQGESDDE